MPASLQARITRTAISPRLATSTFCSGLTSGESATGCLLRRRRDPAQRSLGPRARASAGRPDRVYLEQVITGAHTLVYAHDYEAARGFFRDVLQLPFADTGGGWLIFRTGPSELATHPNRWGDEPADRVEESFDVSLMCDDLAATVEELRGRGAEFDGGVVEQPWGHTI